MKRMLVFLAFFLAVAPARGEVPPLVLAEGNGESFVYDISYLWFDRLAEGRLSVAAGERPGTYRAELEARTLGVAGWLTGDRTQRYVSVMEKGPDGQLHFLSHEASIATGKGEKREVRGKRYLFDAERGTVLYQRLKMGRISRETPIPIDRRTPPSDILTAFFNFRSGVFGPIVPGRRYVIPTFSHKGISEIVVETIPEAERNRYPDFPAGGLLARVTVDGEIFDTQGGHVFVWFDEKGAPARGMVEGVIGLGTVRGMRRVSSGAE